jgi:hypothetical protein
MLLKEPTSVARLHQGWSATDGIGGTSQAPERTSCYLVATEFGYTGRTETDTRDAAPDLSCPCGWHSLQETTRTGLRIRRSFVARSLNGQS